MKWLALPFVLLVGAIVAASVVSEAAMLVDVGGVLMLGLYLIVPALVGIDAWRDRQCGPVADQAAPETGGFERT